MNKIICPNCGEECIELKHHHMDLNGDYMHLFNLVCPGCSSVTRVSFFCGTEYTNEQLQDCMTYDPYRFRTILSRRGING